jgi:hypothetical protein
VRAQRLLLGGLVAVALLIGGAVPAGATTHGGRAKTPATLYEAASEKSASAQSQFYASMTTSPVLSVVSKRAITLATTYTKFAKALAHIRWQGKAKKDSRNFENYLRTFSQFLLTIKLQSPSTMSSWSDQLTAIDNAGHKSFDALNEDLGFKARASTPARGTPGVGSTTTEPSSSKVTTPPVTQPPDTAPPVTTPPVKAPSATTTVVGVPPTVPVTTTTVPPPVTTTTVSTVTTQVPSFIGTDVYPGSIVIGRHWEVGTWLLEIEGCVPESPPAGNSNAGGKVIGQGPLPGTSVTHGAVVPTTTGGWNTVYVTVELWDSTDTMNACTNTPYN